VKFDFDFQSRCDLGYKVIDRINEYYASLPDGPVQPPLDRRIRRRGTSHMPEYGQDPSAVLDEILNELIDGGFHTASANYFGLQNPTPTYVSVLGEALAAALNPQLASLVHSDIPSQIERETVRWVGDRVGWEGAFDGTFTSGGSEANFTALALALAAQFPNVIENGVAALGERPVLYCTAEAHHSLDKAAGLLGLGRSALRRIPVTTAIQLDVRRLEAQIAQDKADGLAPYCAVATAGTTGSGAVDDIDAIAEICRRHGLWLHVDGAYGAALVLSERHRHLIRGIEHADSITMDPHKWLATSMSAGMVLTTHPDTLRQVFATGNSYMPSAADWARLDNFDLGLQWSRRMNSLKFWLTLRVHGRSAYEELFDHQLGLARDFTDWVRGSAEFELAAPTMLTSIIFRVRLPSASEAEIKAANEDLVRDITRDGRRYISAASVGGRSVIRVLLISYLSEARHLADLKEALIAAVERQERPVPLRA
jgi:glutamate/tyrosine decarboxylase-like PLP-dependent enzyme